jgi:hypothetical protein
MPLFDEDRRGHAALFAQKAEQQMLRTDVLVEKSVGFFGGTTERTFHFSAERDLDGR